VITNPFRLNTSLIWVKKNLNKVQSCDAVISHAEMGNIAIAMKPQKPLLVLPCLKRYGEVVSHGSVFFE
jgi:UDP-N-acetylglucosamine transferase subunit ALG13